MRARRLAPLAVACLLLTACSDSDVLPPAPPDPPASPTLGPPTIPTPAPYPTVSSVSTALAKQLAAAGVLTAADLPGWTTTSQTFDASDKSREDQDKECMRVALTPYAARDFGRTFEKDAVVISASADVTATREQSVAEMAAWHSLDGPRCYRERFLKAGAAEMTIDIVPTTVLGADDAVAYRVSFTIAGPSGIVRGGGFQIFALVGQTEITIDTYEEVATPTFSLEKLATLAGTVAQRVRTTATPAPSSTVTPNVSPSMTPAPTGTARLTSSPTPTRTVS